MSQVASVLPVYFSHLALRSALSLRVFFHRPLLFLFHFPGVFVLRMVAGVSLRAG